jgi:glycosyltransferase involved in cell wall biosynthesis
MPDKNYLRSATDYSRRQGYLRWHDSCFISRKAKPNNSRGGNMKQEATVWLIVDSRTNGGIETHIQELARGLNNTDTRVAVVFLKDHGAHPLRWALEKEGLETFTLDGRFLSLVKRLRKCYKAGLYCCAAARIVGCAHVSTFHAGEFGTGKVAVYDWLHRQSSHLNDCNFAVSTEIADRVPKLPLVLNNFVSLPELPSKCGIQLAFVGRLSKEKGPDQLLQIASRMAQAEINFYGSGPLLSELKSQASGNCLFHGNQNDMALRWRDIGLLLMPSRHEGMPMAALEAMARRIPVIAFDVGDLGRVVNSGENGWLVKSGDIEGFQRAIERWIALDDHRRDEMRDAARQRIVDGFSSQQVIPLIIDQYRRSAAGRLPVCDAYCKQLPGRR